MSKRNSIYFKKDSEYEREKDYLAAADIDSQSRDIIIRWHQRLFATGSGKSRVRKVSSEMRKLCTMLGKPLPEATPDDLERLVAEINTSDEWSEATKADYRRCIRQFWGWYSEENGALDGENPHLAKVFRYVTSIRTSYKREKIDFSEIITEDETKQIIQKGCTNHMERAFIAVLHESGFRIGEMLNVKLKDVIVGSNKITVHVDGKTGRRQVPLFISTGHLLRWIEIHPQKEDHTAFLWVSTSPAHKGNCLKHVGASKLLQRSMKRAGIKKKYNAHWFRHSRATINAEFMSEAMMCEFFGWVLGSRQLRTYVHPHARQVEETLMRMRGIEPEQKQQQTVTACSSCDFTNETDAKYCSRCGKPLTVETAIKEQEYLERSFDLLQKIMSDPELRNKFHTLH